MIDDTSAATLPELPPANPPPLFTVDLGDNGGLFAPTSLEEIRSWIEQETSVWNQIFWRQDSNHAPRPKAVEEGVRCLRDARSALDTADPSRPPEQRDPNALDRCRNQISNAFAQIRMPHSSTQLGKRIALLTAEDSVAASFFASIYLDGTPGKNALTMDARGWRGLVEGLIARYNLNEEPFRDSMIARQGALDELHGKFEGLFSRGTEALGILEQHYRETGDAISAVHADQTKVFTAAHAARDSQFDTLKNDHATAMESIRKAFREEIGMRAPVDYWKSKRLRHRLQAFVLGVLALGSMAAAIHELPSQVEPLLGLTEKILVPPPWRLGMLGLMGLLAVWGLRLVVRMFLSNLHLSTDADERMVMVNTYLALIEGGHIKDEKSRELILQALFRPASDGIVKDEGIPASFFELLTRNSKP